MNQRWLELIGYSKGNLKLVGLFTCDLNYFETLVSERERTCKGEREAEISGCSVGTGYTGVTEARNLVAMPALTCIKSGKAGESSKNPSSFWFGCRVFCVLMLLFLLFPIFKTSQVPILSRRDTPGSLSRLLTLFHRERAILWLIGGILMWLAGLTALVKMKNCGSQNFTEGEETKAATLKKQNTGRWHRLKYCIDWN